VILGLMAVCAAVAAAGQEAPPAAPRGPRQIGDTVFHNSRAFRIPFNVDEAARSQLKEIQLIVSSDYGKSWQSEGTVGPDQPTFTFHAPRDSEYWFATRLVNKRGVLYPPETAAVEPSLKVRVDTVPPLITLNRVGRTGDRVKVRWEISDETLDPQTLTIMYRAEGSPDWRQVPLTRASLIGAEEWDCGTAAPLTVRASVEDKAGNLAATDLSFEAGIARPRPRADAAGAPGPAPPVRPFSNDLAAGAAAGPDGSVGGQASASTARAGYDGGDDAGGFAPVGTSPGMDPDQFFGPADGFNSASADAATASVPRGRSGFSAGVPVGRMTGVRAGNVREADVEPEPEVEKMLVASPRFNLEYAVDGASQNGPALVELWVTRDGGRSWTPQPEDADRKSPYPVDLGGEGTFGLWLVVQSASGLGESAPRPGDRPMQWVMVDSTPPLVEMGIPGVGHGPQLGKVLLTWRAADANLDRQPVVLSYRDADQPGSPWIPITDRIDNTGRFVWTVPSDSPSRLHLRIDVVDRLGNKAHVETTSTGNPVIVDQSRPRGRILGLKPGADGSGSPAPRR
jgi:hypothetical protein